MVRRKVSFSILYSLFAIRYSPSLFALLDDRHDLARARHAGPCLVEIRDQALYHVRRGTPIERGAVGELIEGDGHGRIALAPAAPRLLCGEGFRRAGQMFISVPGVERRALAGIGDGRAHDEQALGHGFLPKKRASPTVGRTAVR